MAARTSIGPSTPGGRAAPSFSVIIQYYAGSQGTESEKPGKGCLESIAMQAGGAVTYVASDKMCQLVQGIRIIIGDTAEGIHAGFELVNMNFHTNGTQPSISNSNIVNGPLLV